MCELLKLTLANWKDEVRKFYVVISSGITIFVIKARSLLPRISVAVS